MIRYIIIGMISVVMAQNTNQEIITFQSANPFSFEEIIMDLENEPIQEVFGTLTLPNDYDPDTKYPLIRSPAICQLSIVGPINETMC